ncbi:hypothetical protein ACFL3S_13000 [Gemmatimonadota bacterium]
MKGEITLRSGVWEWGLVELREGGTNTLEARYFAFRLKGHRGSIMRLKIPGSGEIDDRVLSSGARHPDVRELKLPEGEIWTFFERPRAGIAMGVPPGYRDPPYETIFRSDHGGFGRGFLPEDCGLGQATDEELLTIVERDGRTW